MFQEFAHTFEETNNVILTDIYAAREIDTGVVSSQKLCEAINEISGNCEYISSFEEIMQYLKENVQENDIILIIGAGNITKLSHMLTK